MSLTFNYHPLIVGAIFLIVIGGTLRLWVRRNRWNVANHDRIQKAREASLIDVFPVQVRVRRSNPRTSNMFTPLKNGFGGIKLVVRAGSAEVAAVGISPNIARAFGVEYFFFADSVEMSRMRFGSLGTPLFTHDWLVISGAIDERRNDLAIRATDGDIARLERALTEAGVRSIESATAIGA